MPGELLIVRKFEALQLCLMRTLRAFFRLQFFLGWLLALLFPFCNL